MKRILLAVLVLTSIAFAQSEVKAVQYQVEVFDSSFTFLRNIENTFEVDSTVNIKLVNVFTGLKTLISNKYNVQFQDSTYNGYLLIADRPAFGSVARWLQIKNVRILGE